MRKITLEMVAIFMAIICALPSVTAAPVYGNKTLDTLELGLGHLYGNYAPQAAKTWSEIITPRNGTVVNLGNATATQEMWSYLMAQNAATPSTFSPLAEQAKLQWQEEAGAKISSSSL